MSLEVIYWQKSVVRYGVTVWHAEWHVIKAFVEKQSLVVDDQSMALNSIALCIALIREPHTSV